MVRRTALRFAVALAASLFAGAACLSPTLPLPPPEVPDTIRPSAEREGMWQIGGHCIPGARVNLWNERTHRGVFADDTDRNGRYLLDIEAEPCDTLLVWQELASDGNGEEASAPRSFIVEERTPDGAPSGTCR